MSKPDVGTSGCEGVLDGVIGSFGLARLRVGESVRSCVYIEEEQGVVSIEVGLCAIYAWRHQGKTRKAS